ncbi:hypothetical protein AXF42_Ash019994 [Apostasia shenzhenica]|uniref:Uncharacterized protein n=1 Tax=Apostasia shenzhenica TaxID=1088818 RepID=A0A2H9ZSH9_9ASPA|nr:hypothetical protein AXF42_Ash019994 [Apostasia shenzhenica]
MNQCGWPISRQTLFSLLLHRAIYNIKLQASKQASGSVRAMAPIRVGIDLVQSPLRVGGLVLGRYIVVRGSMEVKITGKTATNEQVMLGVTEARNVVQSYFGSPSFDAAVLVVGNNLSDNRLEIISGIARSIGFNVTQVVREYTAISAAYYEKENLERDTTIVIISLNGGILDVSLLTLELSYQYVLHFHEASREPIHFEKHQEESHQFGGIFGFVAGAVKTVVLDPIDKAFNILKDILSADKFKEHPEPSKVVFVGQAGGFEKLRQAAKERFPQAEVWAGVDDPTELGAIGASVLSYQDRKLEMNPRSKLSRTYDPEEDSNIN